MNEALLHNALGNRFLASLSLAARNRILSACTFREMPVGSFLYRPEEQTRFCYFLTSGLASVVIPMAEGHSAEVLLVGKEGVTGCMQMLGSAANPTCCFIQLPATGFRVRHDHLMEIFLDCEETRSRILEFIQQEVFTLTQLAGCNRLHAAESRLARWLLMAEDRTGIPQLNFTQEFLGEMLCLNRTTVSAIAAALHQAGHIDYARGRLTIRDRPGLEASACTCYRTAKKLFLNLYGKPWGSHHPLGEKKQGNSSAYVG